MSGKVVQLKVALKCYCSQEQQSGFSSNRFDFSNFPLVEFRTRLHFGHGSDKNAQLLQQSIMTSLENPRHLHKKKLIRIEARIESNRSSNRIEASSSFSPKASCLYLFLLQLRSSSKLHVVMFQPKLQ